VSGSGISWAICKSAPRPRQITTQASHHSEIHNKCATSSHMRKPVLPLLKVRSDHLQFNNNNYNNYNNHFMPLVWDYPGELVPEETLTHSHLSWSSTIPYQLPPSITIHSILPVQWAWQPFCTISLQALVGLPLGLEPPLHTPYIFSPNHCLLFATHVHTIASCFAVVPILYHLILVTLLTLYLELYLLL